MKTSTLPIYSLLLTRLNHTRIQLSSHLFIVAIKNTWPCRKCKTSEHKNSKNNNNSWEPIMCQDFTSIVLPKYNNSAVKKSFHRQRKGTLREFKPHFYNYIFRKLPNEGLRVYLTCLKDFTSAVPKIKLYTLKLIHKNHILLKNISVSLSEHKHG